MFVKSQRGPSKRWERPFSGIEGYGSYFAIINERLRANVSTQIFLEDISDFSAMNEEYSKWFTGDQRPARSCVAVKQLPRGSPVEIECIARVSHRYLLYFRQC